MLSSSINLNRIDSFLLSRASSHKDASMVAECFHPRSSKTSSACLCCSSLRHWYIPSLMYMKTIGFISLQASAVFPHATTDQSIALETPCYPARAEILARPGDTICREGQRGRDYAVTFRSLSCNDGCSQSPHTQYTQVLPLVPFVFFVMRLAFS